MNAKAFSITSIVIAMSFLGGGAFAANEPSVCSDGQILTLSDLDTVTGRCAAQSVKIEIAPSSFIVVPPPGQTYGMTIDQQSGSDVEALVHTGLDDRIGAFVNGTAYGAEFNSSSSLLGSSVQVAVSTVLGCTNNAYQTLGNIWKSTYNWRYNPANQPNTGSLTSIRSGMNSWRSGTDQCTGGAYSSNSGSGYLGTTTLASSALNSTCSGPDSSSVVGWRAQTSGILGYTCNYPTVGTTIESDVSFNPNFSWFVSTGTTGCANSYDLQTIATHEFGHVLGLAHTANSNSGQVMQPNFGYCTMGLRNLGWADLNGVKSLYP